MNTERNRKAKTQWLLSERDDQISIRLAEARLKAQPLTDFPGRLPETLEQAYAIQVATLNRWPDEIAGWKVAMLPLPDRPRFRDERLAGPVFRSCIHSVEPGSRTVIPVYEGGFAAVEAEFVLVLGESVQPARREYSDADLAGIISAVHGGAEIASSPMAMVNQRGATSIISDLGINAGVLAGPHIPDFASHPLESMPVAVTVDDAVVGEATAAAIPGGPLGALRFLIGHCAERGVELPAGTWVSSGAVTGVHDVRMDSIARVEFGLFGGFEVAFEPIAPRL